MSRYPQMSQAAAYDRSLLVGVPTPTPADRQAGYDINALEQGSNYPSFSRPKPPPPAPVNPFADENGYEPQPTPEPSMAPQKPWYKTTKGRTLIGLAVIIFIGLIAGIAAGTASARQSKNTTLLSNSPTAAQNQDQDPASANTPQATDSPNLLPSSDATNPTTTTPVQQPAATLTFGNNNGNNGGRHSSSTPGSNNQPTTLVFGGGATATLVSPTQATGGNGNSNNNGNGEIPAICYVFPELEECLPYYDNGS